jgi:molybdopterin converting factor small subunit
VGIQVFLHPHFNDVVKGAQTVEAVGETMMQVIEDIEGKYPGFKAEVIDEVGKFRGFLEIFLNGQALFPDETGKKVKDGDEIAIFVMVGGG